MAKPNVCVLRAPGTNCDVETAYAFQSAGARAERVHLFRLLENSRLLSEFQILCIPGGFSYGDDIGAGVIFSRQLRGRLGQAIGEFLTADKLVLGICNGFQVLLKAGILPSGASNWPADSEPEATLTWNDNHKYTARWVRLKVVSSLNAFLRGIDEIELPIAHAEGRIAVRDDSVWQEWAQREQIALCYVPRRVPSKRAVAQARAQSGDAFLTPFSSLLSPIGYPDNPNGSIANIAGLSDPTGRVLGLMPHPERFLHATQHPQWTRLRLSGEGDGATLFKNGVAYFRD